MADVLTGFTWDRSAKRYRSSGTGRYVARNEIVNLLGTHISGGEGRVEALTRALYEGTIAPAVFAEQMRTQLRRLHLQNAALGAGGWDRLNSSDYGRIGQRLREDYGRINKLIGDVRDGNATIAQVLNRANGYVGNSRIAFWETERTAQSVPEPGKVIIERRVLGAHKSCRDCLNYYAAGWQPLGALPLPGLSCACGTNCKCRMERRQVTADEAGQYVKRSLADVITAAGAKRAAALDAAVAKKVAKASPTQEKKRTTKAKPESLRLQYSAPVEQLKRVAAHVDEQIAELAPQYGVSAKKFEQTISKSFKKLVADNPVAIQFPSEYVDSLLTDGRFKTQFETGSGKGITNTTYRSNAEERGIGIPQNIADKDRPVYAFLDVGQGARANVRDYGDLTFVFKDDVKKRATVTTGDSLFNFAQREVAGTPALAPTKHSWDTSVEALYDYATGGTPGELVGQVRYIEMQIQRGASLADVRGVVDYGGVLNAAQRQALIDRGIEIWNR